MLHVVTTVTNRTGGVLITLSEALDITIQSFVEGLCTPRSRARSFSPVVRTQGQRMGITDRTVVRAMARHRWRQSQYVGLTAMQLEHSRRRADCEHQRRAREQVERRSDEVGRADGAGRSTTSFILTPPPNEASAFMIRVRVHSKQAETVTLNTQEILG